MPNRIAQIGGTLGRAYMKDRDRRRREKVEDYAYDSRVASDEAEKEAMQKQEALAPYVSKYVQALQSGDKNMANTAYQELVTRLQDPEKMAKFSQMHQQFLQRVDNKARTQANDTFDQNLRAAKAGYRIADDGTLIEEKREKVRQLITGGKGKQSSPHSGAKSPQLPPAPDPRTRQAGERRYYQLKEESAPEVEGKSLEEYLQEYERIIHGRSKPTPPSDSITFSPRESAMQDVPGRIAGANVQVDVPSAATESTRVTPAQSEVGTAQGLSKEQDALARQKAKKQANKLGKPEMEEDLYQKLVQELLKGK